MSCKDNRFVVVEYTAFYYANEREFSEKVIGIGVRDQTTGLVYPCPPLINFIKTKYRGKSRGLSTQRNAAYEITKFLNYLTKQTQLGVQEFQDLIEKGLLGLRRTHASHYISFLSMRARSEELSSSYVFRVETYLISFYDWLVKNNIVSEAINFADGSPFDDLELGTIYPGRDENVRENLVDFGENRLELLQRFIKISQDVAPEITLGICFELFGGVRTGGVVNLTKDALESPNYWNEQDLGETKFILKIRDRQSQLFGKKRNLQHEGVKVPRNQSLLVNPLLSKIYKEHKEYLKRLENRKKIINNNALFVNPRTGEPITGKTYKELFNKVKMAFIKSLVDEGRTEEVLFLTDKPWSTHICRGVFTNILLEMGASVTEVAIARGDKNLKSLLKYVEEKNALKLTKEAIEKIRKAAEVQEATIDDGLIYSFKLAG
ncbi:site-specific integrase [Neobacillus cucumis]|uniref:site-specific integrase n=1 Tax=Neobacillus cucumis TaxID=1740721 RepID=UPI00196484D8|nr:site-specific integrase [Neobacillus cucumis]MBM7651777.1 hypothetical protein [Neobacillus cucumis]